MTRSTAPESGVYRRVVWAVFIISMLVFIASRLSIAVPDFRRAWVAGATAGQPTVLARAKAGHKAGEGCHCPWLFLAEVSREPFIPDTVFESR